MPPCKVVHVKFDGDNGDMIILNDARSEITRVIRGVVLIDQSDWANAERYGWYRQTRATTQSEIDRGLIRVVKI